MRKFEPNLYGALIEQDLDRLVHASHNSGEIDVPEVLEADLEEVAALTDSLASLRQAERDLSESSRQTLNLSAQEMRALQFLVVSLRRGELVTPSKIANHLCISPASTTKLLNRLERGQHIVRTLHPHDRRAIKIEVTPRTEAITQRSVGRQQARRLAAAIRLTSEDRKTVTHFLDELRRGIEFDRESWTSFHEQATVHNRSAHVIASDTGPDVSKGVDS